MHCLVVGATGYIGSRLVPRLLDAGHSVRVLARDPARLDGQEWARAVEVEQGDATDRDDVASACDGMDAVVHLVHAMDGPGYADRDRVAAEALADGAAAAGVHRIVYLGGLQPAADTNGVSGHLSSRREVGDILLAGPVPTVVLKAGIVVGTGSASFEMIRHLTETAMGGPFVLPLPDRMWNRIQPIAVDDVLHIIVGCLDLPAEVNRGFDIGGPEVLTYQRLMSGYAAEAGLRRPLPIPVPVSAPKLTARAVAALTPVQRGLAEPLVESMKHELVADEQDLKELSALVGDPPGGPTPYRTAVRRALDEAGSAGPGPSDAPGSGPLELVSEHVHDVGAPAAAVWSVIAGLGGDTGWYTVPGVWTVRGWVDGLLGGPGNRRTKPSRR
ncbi:MAG: NAD(P)H-binding protein [Pseudonocardia sediminis]